MSLTFCTWQPSITVTRTIPTILAALIIRISKFPFMVICDMSSRYCSEPGAVDTCYYIAASTINVPNDISYLDCIKVYHFTTSFGFHSSHGQLDVVIGIPEGKKRKLIREIGSYIKNEINTIMFDKPRHLRAGCFRMMTDELAKKLLDFKTANPIIGALIFKATRRIKNVKVMHREGMRKSNYSLMKLINTFFYNLQNYSEFPLRYISMAGLLLSALSILMTIYYLIRYFTGFPRPIQALGWTSLIVAITFFSGAILFSLGFIGQYIFKIIEEVNKMPNYQIRNIKDYSNRQK